MGPTQQASSAAALLAVAHGAKALGLAGHGYLFEQGAASGVLFGPFFIGWCAASLAVIVATLCAPPDDVWRLPPNAQDTHTAHGRVGHDAPPTQAHQE